MKNFIQTIKGISAEKLIHHFAEISVDMCKKQEYLRDVDVQFFQGNVRRSMRVTLSAWDIHGIQYHVICNSNDYRNSISVYTIGQIVNLYRRFEDQESPAEALKEADLSGVFKILFGLISEQLPFQNMGWIFENFNRNYHILVSSDKINRNLTFSLEQIIREKFGWSISEYLSVQLIVYWLCMQHCNPLTAPESMYKKKNDTVLTKENIRKFIVYYSCNYKDVRTSPMKKQLFYSRPFIHTDKSKAYIASNCYLVSWMISNSLYWLMRDYYNELGSQEFVNAFGVMFEDYLKELAEKHFSPEQWNVIPRAKKKSADFYFDLNDAILVIEQKSSLIRLSAKQQTSNLEVLNKFITTAIIGAYGQIQATCEEIDSSKPVLKIILLYEMIENTGLIEMSVPEIFGTNDKCYIMTIWELEIMFHLWSTDRAKCLELLQKMLTGKQNDDIGGCSITKIYKEMGLYALHGIAGELDYFQMQLENLRKELDANFKPEIKL